MTDPVRSPEVRPGCPPWCAEHPVIDGEVRPAHHRSITRQFVTPDFWAIRVYLYQLGDDKPIMRVGGLGLQPDDAYPHDQRHDLAVLLRMLGHQDIAAAVEELAALAAGTGGAR